jgi:chromate transporter
VVALALGLATPGAGLRVDQVATTSGDRATLTDIALLNLKTALVTFGGAYTALPYMRDQVVHRHGWLSDGVMLDALALGETTPGPLISIGVFVSYLAAGVPGALTGAFFLFLPSFVFVLTLGRYVERITALPGVPRLLEGIMAATIGLILALTIDVAGGIHGVSSALIAAGAFAAVAFVRISPAWIVVAVSAGAVAVHTLF